MSTLLVDVGNSRLKWTLDDGSGRSGDVRALVHEGDPAAVVGQIDLRKNPTAIWIANVTGPSLGTALVQALQARFGVVPRMATVAAERLGLTIAYTDPARLGVDRWLGMLAAWGGARRACIVVSVGTALTVDIVAAEGRHLGGVIAPGLIAAQKAVLGATRFVAAGPQTAFTDELGIDTDGCVRQGALHSCAGLVDRLASRYPDASRLLTGGDAPILAPLLADAWQQTPELVLTGLRTLAKSQD